MKKKLLGALLVLAMLAAFTGTVSAAPLAGSAVELLSARAGMNGTVFQFRVSGEFSRAELQGRAVVQGGESYSLDCRQIDDETVRCTTSLKVQGNVTVTFGGSTFWTFIKPFTKYCYNIVDWNFADPLPSDHWVVAGNHCQSYPAQEGQMISFFNPDWSGTYDYFFLLNSPDPCGRTFPPSGEDAFYYTGC